MCEWTIVPAGLPDAWAQAMLQTKAQEGKVPTIIQEGKIQSTETNLKRECGKAKGYT